MTISDIGLTIHTLGEVLVAVTALQVHNRVHKEHKISRSVYQAMKREKVFGLLGVLCIIFGYFLELSV